MTKEKLESILKEWVSEPLENDKRQIRKVVLELLDGDVFDEVKYLEAAAVMLENDFIPQEAVYDLVNTLVSKGVNPSLVKDPDKVGYIAEILYLKKNYAGIEMLLPKYEKLILQIALQDDDAELMKIMINKGFDYQAAKFSDSLFGENNIGLMKQNQLLLPL